MGKKSQDLKVYIGMAGLRGYMPAYCEVYASKRQAAESLCLIHDVPTRGRNSKLGELIKWGDVDIDLETHGNEYMEIQEYSVQEYLSMNDIKVEEIPQLVQFGELPEELMVLVEEE